MTSPQYNVINNKDLFFSDNFQYYEVNKESPQVNCNNFLHGIENAKNILQSLEKSLKRTRDYEDQLLLCKSKHSHVHNKENESQYSDVQSCNVSETEKSKTPRSAVNLQETWSTMSNVCLQYQYEELSSRYESLLRAYDDRCKLTDYKDAALCRLRERMRRNQKRLMDSNKALLAVGQKYMILRKKRIVEKDWYEERIEQLKQRVQDIAKTAERARLELDDQLSTYLLDKDDDSASLLLEEIKKCNLLFLENIQLKSLLQDN